MESWVYIFSRFTQEALLFEALTLFGGCAAYAAFYITRRRKFGVAGQEIPSNLVKVYLAQLVADAEEMRNQLFGLLGKGSAEGKLFNIHLHQAGAGIALPQAAAPAPSVDSHAPLAAAPMATIDPELAQKLKDVEAKMQEQAKALDAVLNEKMRLEEELAVSKRRPEAGSGEDSLDDSAAERLKTLEAQLAEYAVIEDDLANLKRLQKENKTLRQQVEKLQEAVPAGTQNPAPEAPAATPALAPVAPAAEVASAPTEPRPPEAFAAAPAEPAESNAAEGSAPSEAFDALVDEVEKSLAADAAPVPSAEADVPAAATAGDKSEEELQADFEKMLKG